MKAVAHSTLSNEVARLNWIIFELVPETRTGVFISDRPLDGDEHVSGNKVLEVDLPEDLDLADYQLIEVGKPYHSGVCQPGFSTGAHADC
jgi:hypothetical protein